MALVTSAQRWFMVWIIFQAQGALHASTENVTICFNSSPLIYHYECNVNEKLLPRKLLFGNSSDDICHDLIRKPPMSRKVIIDCCKQLRNDRRIEYCLPGKGSTINEQYYLDLIHNCTGVESCALLPPTSFIQHTTSEDYVTFVFDCIDDSSILHLNNNGEITGTELYLYNDQNDGSVHAECVAYAMNCREKITAEVVASNVQAQICTIIFDDGSNIFPAKCKYPPSTSTCAVQYHSMSSNYMKISIDMTTEPSKVFKEFLWIKLTASANSDVVVACGNAVPQSVTGLCTTSTMMKTESTTLVSPSNGKFLTGECQLWNIVTIVLGALCIALCVGLAVLCRFFRKLKTEVRKSIHDQIPLHRLSAGSLDNDRNVRRHSDRDQSMRNSYQGNTPDCENNFHDSGIYDNAIHERAGPRRDYATRQTMSNDFTIPHQQ